MATILGAFDSSNSLTGIFKKIWAANGRRRHDRSHYIYAYYRLDSLKVDEKFPKSKFLGAKNMLSRYFCLHLHFKFISSAQGHRHQLSRTTNTTQSYSPQNRRHNAPKTIITYDDYPSNLIFGHSLDFSTLFDCLSEFHISRGQLREVKKETARMRMWTWF